MVYLSGETLECPKGPQMVAPGYTPHYTHRACNSPQGYDWHTIGINH